ncbi:MAG: hypothetical protein ACRDQD_26980 [Nocardioidaceae bacterium]
MDQPHLETDNTRVALECLTLWMEPADEARYRAVQHISHLVHDADGPGAVNIISGLLDLSMFLVMSLARECGAGDEDLLTMAGDFLRQLSPQLPE